ncbi:hypothetical protein CN514_20960 [Bacillus sp. AFS001701]|uniref:transposase n=1 Tax=Bacillus sp. AFS001701 TaxID=2033480 RepID=UPI000BF86EB0|nr:hypothetical protein CN514_20960 [Bacillus sp. AFS001701]
MSYREFRYYNETDRYICPNNKELPFTHLKNSKGQYSKIYSAKAKVCKICPFREKCFVKSSSKRTIARPIAHELTEANLKRSKTDKYKQIQKQRRVWCEGTFGTMKTKHNLYKTYKRGIQKILEQYLFSALALNLKRMIKVIN